MKKLPVILLFTFFLNVSFSNMDKAESKITYRGLERDIQILAADSLMGRAPFTEGEKKTLEYLKSRMMAIGLEPAFGDSFFQKVPLVEINSISSPNLAINTIKGKIPLKVGGDFTAWSPLLSNEISIENSELIFVGYGINAPEFSWNDFEGINVKGKTIVVLINDPGYHTGNKDLFSGNAMTFYGRWTYKFEEANRQGATGCFIVHEDGAAGYPWSVVNGRPTRSDIYLDNEATVTRDCKLNGWLTLAAAEKLFAACGMDYHAMKLKATDRAFNAIEMKANYSIEVKNSWKKSNSYNVGGVIRGAVRPDEAIVYTAHWDHLGIGEPVDGDSIYNGASDNAAAVAWMLSIAEAFCELNEKPQRSILFLSPTAEEAGMLGSQYYANNPVFAHNKTAACFNSDVIMFLGEFKDVTITGLGHSELDSLLEEEAKKQGRYICNDPNPENGMFYRSDQLPFLMAGVPSLFAKGYSHQVDMGRKATLKAVDDYWKNTYHKPSDKYIPETHDLSGLLNDTKLFFRVGYKLANTTYFPKWNKESEFYAER